MRAEPPHKPPAPGDGSAIPDPEPPSKPTSHVPGSSVGLGVLVFLGAWAATAEILGSSGYTGITTFLVGFAGAVIAYQAERLRVDQVGARRTRRKRWAIVGIAAVCGLIVFGIGAANEESASNQDVVSEPQGPLQVAAPTAPTPPTTAPSPAPTEAPPKTTPAPPRDPARAHHTFYLDTPDSQSWRGVRVAVSVAQDDRRDETFLPLVRAYLGRKRCRWRRVYVGDRLEMTYRHHRYVLIVEFANSIYETATLSATRVRTKSRLGLSCARA